MTWVVSSLCFVGGRASVCECEPCTSWGKSWVEHCSIQLQPLPISIYLKCLSLRHQGCFCSCAWYDPTQFLSSHHTSFQTYHSLVSMQTFLMRFKVCGCWRNVCCNQANNLSKLLWQADGKLVFNRNCCLGLGLVRSKEDCWILSLGLCNVNWSPGI